LIFENPLYDLDYAEVSWPLKDIVTEPEPVINKSLEQNDMTLDQAKLIKINEVFRGVVLVGP
jgi:hypothetical protein